MAAASRESQSMLISVIIFAILTVILALTTYLGYTAADASRKQMLEAQSLQANSVKDLNLALYKMRAYERVIGVEGVDEAAVDQARTRAGGVEDETVKRVTAEFNKDMEMFAAEAAPEGPRNYRTLPKYLLDVITKKNEIIADVNSREKKLVAEKDAFQTKETAQTKAAVGVQMVAEADLAKRTTDFNDERQRITEEKNKLGTQIASKDKQIKDVTDKATKEREQLEKELVRYQQLSTALKGQVQSIQKESQFENPDGKVKWVNQQQRLAWIDLGLSDGLSRQTTFSVYNHDQAGVSSAKPKGRIEVIRITGPHMSECRILDDELTNPIMPNDLIHTPAWSPGQEVRFALVGFMDINGDGVSDRETVKRVISINGGIIDAELNDDGTREGTFSINTRYLIQGSKPNEKTGANVLAEYNKMLEEVQRYNVEIVSVQKLLERMGWKAEEKKVDFKGGKDLGNFRRREPGAAPAPGDGPAPEGAPAPKAAPKPMEEAADPFK